MILHLRHNEIDKQKWDESIANSRNTLVYAYSWYLDVVSPQWEALVDDEYKAVMPLTWRKRFGIRYLCQPFFVQKLGVFSPEEVTNAHLEAFVEKAKSLFSFAEINLNADNVFGDMPRHRNFELDLDDYEQLESRYHDNTHRNLSRAQKSNLVVQDLADIDKVIALFDADRRQKIESFETKSYDVLRALADKALERGDGFIRGVSDGDGKLLAAAFFVSDGHKLTFMFSGNSAEGKQVQAMTFLIDSVVREYSGYGRILDFEGSDDEGLARFYAGFGARLIEYGSLRYNNMSWFSNLILAVWKKMK